MDCHNGAGLKHFSQPDGTRIQAGKILGITVFILQLGFIRSHTATGSAQGPSAGREGARALVSSPDAGFYCALVLSV